MSNTDIETGIPYLKKEVITQNNCWSEIKRGGIIESTGLQNQFLQRTMKANCLHILLNIKKVDR